MAVMQTKVRLNPLQLCLFFLVFLESSLLDSSLHDSQVNGFIRLHRVCLFFPPIEMDKNGTKIYFQLLFAL